MSLDRGDVVGGHFEVERILASHFGYNVYRARHILLGKPVALKVLIRSKSDWAASFFDAAAELQALEPGAMVGCLGQGAAGRANRFFAFEWVTGETITDHLPRPLEKGSLLEVGAEVAGALAQLHARELCHGAVRPNRIVMSKKGPRLLDPVVPPSEGLLALKAVYVAPEIIVGGAAGQPASDVYALGATLYHAIQGAPPHVGKTLVAVMLRILFDTPDPLPRSADHLRPWIASMLSPQPFERPRAELVERAFRAEAEKPGASKSHLPDAGAPAREATQLRALALVRSASTPDESWQRTVTDLGGKAVRLVERTTLVHFGSDCPRDPAASVLELTRRTRDSMPRAAVAAGVVEPDRPLRALLDQMAALIATTQNGTVRLHEALERQAPTAARKGGTLEIEIELLDNSGPIPSRGPNGTLVLEPESAASGEVEPSDTLEIELPPGLRDVSPDSQIDRPTHAVLRPTPTEVAIDSESGALPTLELEVDEKLLERSKARTIPLDRAPRSKVPKWSRT